MSGIGLRIPASFAGALERRCSGSRQNADVAGEGSRVTRARTAMLSAEPEVSRVNPQFPAIDLVEELRLRRWARLNYVCESQRRSDWHPVILNEMQLRDHETAENSDAGTGPESLVPLPDSRILRIDQAHAFPTRSRQTATPATARGEFHYS